MSEALTYTFTSPDYQETTVDLLDHVLNGGIGTVGLSSATPDGSGWTDKFFDWPRQKDDAIQWLHSESDEGRNAYFCTHLLTARGRSKENAAAVSTLWVEADYGRVPADIPPPTAEVESSPGRFYYFWKLDRSVDPQLGEQLNRRLANALAGDSGWHLGKVLRPSGTINYKYPARPVVDLKPIRESAYDPAFLDTALPQVADTPEPTAVDLSGPPVALSGYDLEVWEGKRPKLKDGQVDHSDTLYKIAAVLYENGLRGQALFDAIAERDEALGYDKYTNRPKEYARIVGKVKQPEPATSDEGWQLFETAKQLCEAGTQDVDWLAYGFPRLAHIQVQGKIKEGGKTTAALELIKACLQGGKFWGHKTHKVQAAIYITEQTKVSFQRALFDAGLDETESLYVVPRSNIAGLAWSDVVKKVAEQVKAVGAEILVIDTFTKITGVEDENATADVQKAMQPLQDAVGDLVTLITVHHERKSGGSLVDRGRGASALGGEFDQILGISRPNDKKLPETVRVIERDGRFNDYMPQFTYVNLEDDGYNLHVRDAKGKEVVYKNLPKHNEYGITLTELTNRVGLGRSTVQEHLTALGDRVEECGMRGRAKLYRKAKVG